MKKIIFIIFKFFFSTYLFAQSSDFWAKQLGGTSNYESGASIAVDGNGNVYTTGNFSGNADFDPSSTLNNMTSFSSSDIFVSKLDALGNFIWAKKIGGTNTNVSRSLILDANNNIYITGNFSGTADFDPGQGNYNLTSHGADDIFILKLSVAGNFIWAKSFGGINSDNSYDITVDANGNVYTTGNFRGNADFDPGSGVYNMTSFGSSDIFVSKLDTFGNFLWAKQMGGTDNEGGISIAIDTNGNTYTTGYFASSVDFDPGSGVYNLTSVTTNNYDIFISKLDAFGNFVWAKQFGGTSNQEEGNSITVSANGNIYITGSFGSTVDFDPGPGIYNLTPVTLGLNDIFISKLNSSGNFLWAKQLGGAYLQIGNSVTVDANENVYTSGFFLGGPLDFNPGQGVYNLIASNRDIYVSKLDASGNYIWAKQLGGDTDDEALGIIVDATGNVYATGYFTNTSDFYPGNGTYNLTSFGGSDIYIVKFNGNQIEFSQPNITLSKSIIPFGETMTIQGQGFSPNGQVALNFFGSGGRYNINVTANVQGSFSYTYNIPANAQNGNASVTAWDANTNKYSIPARNFQIQVTPLNTAIDFLNITSQQNGGSYSVGEQIHFIWNDKLQRQYADYFYPMQGITANRQYKYRIEYQIGSSGIWQLANTIQGSGALNSVINLSMTVQINMPDNNCRIRIIDDYAPAIVKTSPVFSVGPVTSNLKVELVWDKSFERPYTSPIGVAADGVARLYVKVSKIDAVIGGVLQSAIVTLSDGSNNSIEMLGKVKAATNIDSYNTEADNANSLSANSNNAQTGSIWFWYVSPDDFSQDYLTTYANESERNVNLHVVAQLSDGSQDNTDFTLKVVRPPLVMVHGIASSEEAWDNFNYGANTLFITSPIFKIKKAINISPNQSYLYNADLILNPNATSVSGGANNLNTLQGNINEIRWLGFASNQVDYVCHSMGGCVLRTAMTVYSSRFYGTSPNEKYKTYGKGFVHKAITINTPHNNTPVADAVTEFMPQASPLVAAGLQAFYGSYPGTPFYFDFIEPQNPNSYIWSWQSSPAVKDLQINNSAGGKNLATTTVKNHLIAGDVDIYDAQTATSLVELDKYMDLLYKVLKIMRDISPPGPVKTTLTAFLQLEKVVAVFSFIEWYSEQKGVVNFIGDGDLIVPLNSQIAAMDQLSDKVSIFHNSEFLNARHTAITDRTDVGDRVKKLLNSPLSGNFFSDMIAATIARSSLINNATIPANQISQIYSYDTSNIKIISPDYNTSIFADSTLNIEFILKDTVGLAYIDIDFQGQTNTSISTTSDQIVSTLIDPSFINSQLISVTAVYDRGSTTEFHSDTIRVNVLTNDQLIGFQVNPKVVELRDGIPFYPNYSAKYNTSIAAVPNNDPNILVSIADPTVVQYNSPVSSFKALSETGSTYAVLTYNSFSDTLYFINTPDIYSGCINHTLANGNWKNPSNWEKGTIPSTCDSVVVMPGHTLIVDTSSQIRALNILAGGVVILADLTVKLQIGGEDDGRNNFINNGTLIISNGTLSINGSLKQTANSNFTMTGGEIIIDGNTGYISTSVDNEKNLFDVSDNMGSFSFIEGVLQITDPPLGSNSQAIHCSYNFGDLSVLKFGDGVSTTASDNPNGFGGNLMPARIGRFILDAATPDNNRIFNNVNPLTIKQSCQIISGHLIQTALLNVEE